MRFGGGRVGILGKCDLKESDGGPSGTRAARTGLAAKTAKQRLGRAGDTGRGRPGPDCRLTSALGFSSLCADAGSMGRRRRLPCVRDRRPMRQMHKLYKIKRASGPDAI